MMFRFQSDLNIWDTKAELPQEGILFRTQFPSLGIFIKKLRPPSIQLLKLIYRTRAIITRS